VILGLGLAMLAAPVPAAPLDADLLLRGGTIHDGSRAAPVVGDVAVRAGRIVGVGKVTPGKIGRAIDCRGMVVAPGLIDLHTHSDGTLAQPGVRPCLNYLMQGCTTMVTGIRSATGLPADIFGIPERGYLRPGYHADIVVFDPAEYLDQATFDKPQLYATGVRYVLLAGQAAIDDGKPVARLLGRALRHRSTKQDSPAAGGRTPFAVHVEAEEIVCYPPAYETTSNGSGMFWGSGSAQMVRIGERLFVSAFEAVPGCAPLNNARWALYERDAPAADHRVWPRGPS
jgi:hypothetical protein